MLKTQLKFSNPPPTHTHTTTTTHKRKNLWKFDYCWSFTLHIVIVWHVYYTRVHGGLSTHTTVLWCKNLPLVYITWEDQEMVFQITNTLWNSMKGRPVLVSYSFFWWHIQYFLWRSFMYWLHHFRVVFIKEKSHLNLLHFFSQWLFLRYDPHCDCHV